jgi:hypothetical protein
MSKHTDDENDTEFQTLLRDLNPTWPEEEEEEDD